MTITKITQIDEATFHRGRNGGFSPADDAASCDHRQKTSPDSDGPSTHALPIDVPCGPAYSAGAHLESEISPRTAASFRDEGGASVSMPGGARGVTVTDDEDDSALRRYETQGGLLKQAFSLPKPAAHCSVGVARSLACCVLTGEADPVDGLAERIEV